MTAPVLCSASFSLDLPLNVSTENLAGPWGDALTLRMLHVLSHTAEGSDTQLEAKLDLLLLLQMQAAATTLPASVPCVIGMTQIAWHTPHCLPLGTPLHLQLFLETGWLPLSLTAHASSSTEPDWEVADFVFPNETVCEYWERYVFQCHRHALQRSRTGNKHTHFR